MPESRLHRAVRRVVNEAIQRGWYQVRAFGAIAPGTNIAERFGSFGENSIIGFPTSALFGERHIEIGDDVWFGQDIYVTDSNHGFSELDVPIGRQLGPRDPVSIGSGSWIGHGAVILPGSRVGRNVVVAAGSVVRGEVPDHCIVGGVPARVIRSLNPAGAA